jgi:hypothetical protein
MWRQSLGETPEGIAEPAAGMRGISEPAPIGHLRDPGGRILRQLAPRGIQPQAGYRLGQRQWPRRPHSLCRYRTELLCAAVIRSVARSGFKRFTSTNRRIPVGEVIVQGLPGRTIGWLNRRHQEPRASRAARLA